MVSSKMQDLDFFFPAVIYEGMVTNGKAKRSEEGLCRPVPRQTFQTFNSSQKWIKLIKLVGNLHALKYSATDTDCDEGCLIPMQRTPTRTSWATTLKLNQF